MKFPSVTGWIAGFMLLLDAALVFAFAQHVLDMGRKRWKSPETDAGIALLVYFTGQGLVRTGTWLSFHQLFGAPAEVLIVGGTSMAVIGAVCAVRVFSRRTWQIVPWLVYIVLAALLSSAVELFW